MTNTKEEQHLKFIDLVKDVKTCMMMIKDAQGKLSARPMNNAKVTMMDLFGFLQTNFPVRLHRYRMKMKSF